MSEQDDDTQGRPEPAAPSLSVDGAALLARYGGELGEAGEGMSEAARQELLLALWRIIEAFADLGFSVKPGDKFSPESGIGMDDVLRSLIPEDTAHETVAPVSSTNAQLE